MDSSGIALNRIAAIGVLTLAVTGCGGGGGNSPAHAANPAAGFAYVANELDETVSIYTLSADGRLTPQGYVPTGTRPLSVTVDAKGRFAYVANFGTAEAGIKRPNRKDLLVIKLDEGAAVAGVFTQNRF